MSAIPRSRAQGITIPHPRIAVAHLNAEDSSYTQRGPRAGIPRPQSAVNRLVLEATGAQDVGTTIETMTLHGGHPGLNGAGFVHRLTDDPELPWLGWDVPQTITAWEAVVWSTAGSGYEQPHAVRLPNDEVLACYSSYTGVSTQTGFVHARRRATDGTWGSEVEIAADPTYGGRIPWGALCPLPSGRVLAFSWVCDQAAAKANIRMRYSDDNGDTWNLGRSFVLRDSIALTANIAPKRIRAAYKDGQILLMAWVRNTTLTYDDVLHQYASSDDGATFSLIHAQAGTAANDDDGSHPDIAVAGGYFIVGLHGADAGTGAYRFARVSDAFTPLPAVAPFDLTLENITVAAAELAFAVDEDGAVYFYFSQTNGEHQVMRSIDYGATWAGMSESDVAADGYGVWAFTTDAATMPRDYCAVAQRGRVLVFHGWDANPGTADYSLGCAYLGGYTDVTMPFLEQFQVDTRQVSYVVQWLPFDKPGDCGWSASGTAAVETLTNGVLDLHTSGGNQRLYVRTVDGDSVETLAAFVVSMSSGSGVVSCEIDYDEGTSNSRALLAVQLSTTTMALVDNSTSPTTIASKSITAGTRYEIRFTLDGVHSKLYAWYRVWSTNEERRWSLLGSATTITDDGGTGSGPRTRLTWGNIGQAEAEWAFVAYTYDAYLGLGLASGQTNPDDLFYRRWSNSFTYVTAGVRMRAVHGPTLQGDTHHTTTRYEYPVEHLLTEVNPSPSAWWESEDDDADQRFVYDFASVNGGGFPDSVAPWSRIWCLHVLKNNAPTIEIDTAVFGAGLSGSPISIDCFEPVEFHRQGGTVELYPVTSGGSDLYLNPDEVRDGYFVFPNGDVRKVIANTGGLVRTGSGAPPFPVLELEGCDGNEDDDGTATLIFPRVCAVFLLPAYYDQIEIAIPAATTYEGRFMLKAHLGPLIAFGTPYSNGWSHFEEHGTTITERRNGQRRASVRHVPRRAFSFAWSEGFHARNTQGAGGGDHITVGGQAAALQGDSAAAMRGWYRYCAGPGKTVSIVPFIDGDALTASGLSVLRPQNQRGAIYGRIMSPVRVNHVVGAEQEREFVRVAEVVIEEEL